MGRNHDCLQELNKKYFREDNDGIVDKSEILSIKIVQERPTFVLSRCDIIIFKKAAILTALGTCLLMDFL